MAAMVMELKVQYVARKVKFEENFQRFYVYNNKKKFLYPMLAAVGLQENIQRISKLIMVGYI